MSPHFGSDIQHHSTLPLQKHAVVPYLVDGVKYCFRLWSRIAPLFFFFMDCGVMIQTAQPMQIHFHNYYTVQSSLHAHKCLHFPNMKQAALIKGFIRMRRTNNTERNTIYSKAELDENMLYVGKWWDVSVLFSLYLILNLYVTHTLQAGQTAWACTALEAAHAGCVSSCLTKKTHRCGADMCADRLKPSREQTCNDKERADAQ